MQDKRSYIFLYLAIASAFVATFASYDISGNLSRLAHSYLPARLAKNVDFALSANSLDLSTLAVGSIGMLITFGIIAGVGLLFMRRKNDIKG